MVDKIRDLIKKIKLEKGEILLCMLLKDSPEIDKWTFIISANWLDRINQQLAFTYWSNQLSSVLNKNELSLIGRITFLNSNNAFVNLVGSLLNITNGAVTIKNTSLGAVTVNEAIVFEAHRKAPVKTRTITNRNPIYNHTINPIYNHTINPIYNHTINPIYNHTINPIYNHTINPIYNHTINPIYNHTINPIYNHTINPIYNHTINPIYNHTINPNYNPNFRGLYFIDRNSNMLGYAIDINENITLIFSPDNTMQSFGVENTIKGYTFFDNNNNWIGQILPNGNNGYNYFSGNNEWVGYLT